MKVALITVLHGLFSGQLWRDWKRRREEKLWALAWELRLKWEREERAAMARRAALAAESETYGNPGGSVASVVAMKHAQRKG